MKHYKHSAALAFLFFLIFTAQIFPQTRVIQKGRDYYLSNTVVVKLKDIPVKQIDGEVMLPAALKSIFENYGIQKTTPAAKGNSLLHKNAESGLERIVEINYTSGDDPSEISKMISKSPLVEWAEPHFVRRVVYSPDDSLYVMGSQQSLKQVLADSAWTVTKGDTSVVIAIIDTGVDWKHPDLAANILKDSNGNLVGYDFGGASGTPDNDPSEDFSDKNKYHGTHVAGIAGAVTDNKIGVASMGFNCRIMPVKVSRGDMRDASGYPYVAYGFDGIKYAVDHGAKVVNCSWGGYSYSNYEQEIINYAVENGVAVIAAAGNDGSDMPFYPASYHGTLSVAWLLTGTNQAIGNYGATVDVLAPGSSITSTWQRDSLNNQLYGTIGGSSMSTPLVSGLAGIAYSKYKNYSPLQIEELIRVNADNVDSANTKKDFLLGRGVVNAYNAVTAKNNISVRAEDVAFIEEGNGNGLLESGETAKIGIKFMNYLSPVDALTMTIETSDANVELVNSVFNAGSIRSLDSLFNNPNQFVFRVKSGAELNHKVLFLLRFSAAGYSDFQWIWKVINPTYDTHNSNNITLSVSSKGAIGFNDYPLNLEGEGFKYLGGFNLMFEGAFMYGNSPEHLMDVARIGEKQSADFVSLYKFKITSPGIVADQEGFTAFNDSGAGSSALGIETHMATYSYTNPPNDNFIILRSILYNKTASDITNLYAGYFIDWDIPAAGFDQDTTAYDAVDNFAYAFNKRNPLSKDITGAALISDDNFGFYAINREDSTEVINLNDLFSDAEKWTAVSGGLKKLKAGVGDIMYVISGGPHTIPAGGYINVAFSLAAGYSLEEVRAAVKQSRKIYAENIPTHIEKSEDKIPAQFSLSQNYPNPFNPETTIKFYIPAITKQIDIETLRATSLRTTLKIYDILGREVATLVNEMKSPGNYEVKFDGKNLSSGVYFYWLRAGEYNQVKKMILLR